MRLDDDLGQLGVSLVNTLRPRQNGRRFPEDIFKCIFLNESIWISIDISLKFVPKGPINNIPALVQIMAWRRLGDKPLSEPMLVCLLTHICVTRPQWVLTMPCWKIFIVTLLQRRWNWVYCFPLSVRPSVDGIVPALYLHNTQRIYFIVHILSAYLTGCVAC